jgi:hypothetical protein
MGIDEMKHPDEYELVVHHYGETGDNGEIAGHLAACEACRARFRGLEQTLALVNLAPVPERSEDYGKEVWRRLVTDLPKTPAKATMRDWLRKAINDRPGISTFPRWAWAGGLALLVVGAFLAGRQWKPVATGPRLESASLSRALPARGRERVLLMEIGDHLERSQRALIELINSQTNGVVDLSFEEALARQLVGVNRLYRQTAVRLGEMGLAGVLEELEHTLIEIANSPAKLSPAEFAGLRSRLETDDVLFKAKVVGSQLREREKQTVRELAAKRS